MVYNGPSLSANKRLALLYGRFSDRLAKGLDEQRAAKAKLRHGRQQQVLGAWMRFNADRLNKRMNQSPFQSADPGVQQQ